MLFVISDYFYNDINGLGMISNRFYYSFVNNIYLSMSIC